MIMTATGFDQHEAHCTFVTVKATPSGWTVVANCSVEGDRQTQTFRLAVERNALTMTRGNIKRRFTRCG